MVDQSCVQKAVWKDLFFSAIYRISTYAGQERVRDTAWGRTSVSIFLQTVVIHTSSLQHRAVLCYFVSFQSDCFTERQRTDFRIKSKLLWKYTLCGSIWSSGEKLKKEFDPNPRIKINVREFNATQGAVEQRLLGLSFIFSYDNQYPALKKKQQCNGFHWIVWRNRITLTNITKHATNQLYWKYIRFL